MGPVSCLWCVGTGRIYTRKTLRAKYKWEVHVNVRFHINVRIPTHCMAQDGRRVPLCGQGIDSLDIVLVGTVIILIGLDVHSRANGHAIRNV